MACTKKASGPQANGFLQRLRRALSFTRREMPDNDLNSLKNFSCDNEIAGILIENMRFVPKNIKNHGLTKIGMPSFYGFYNGKKVKLYGVKDPGQVELRKAVEVLPGGLKLPKIIGSEGSFIVQEWVEGTAGTELDDEQRERLYQVLLSYFAELKHQSRFNEAPPPAIACDYLDYLEERVVPWIFLNDIKEFRQEWLKLYEERKQAIPQYVHHADLSLANIVLNHDDNKFYVIDNELLSYGRGWIIDYHNSALSCSEKYRNATQDNDEFVDKTWVLRRIGSMLLAGDLKKALDMANQGLGKLSGSQEVIEAHYKGKKAQDYETARKKNPKWEFEQNTVALLLARCFEQNSSLKSVMDIPVGTNRFADLVLSIPQIEKAYGLDYSDDMLAEAAQKRIEKYEFVKHDIFAGGLELSADVVVCLRFLNLFPWQDIVTALTNLASLAKAFLILSIRLADDRYSGPMHVENKIYIHKRSDFLAQLNTLGVTVEARHVYEDTRGGTYQILLLRKAVG